MTGFSDAPRRLTLVLGVAIVALLAIPQAARAQQHPGPPLIVVLPAAPDPAALSLPGDREQPAPPVDIHPHARDLRGLAVFGAVVSLQLAATSAALFISIGVDGMSDATVNTSFGLMLGLMPLVDSAFGYLVARGSRAFRPSFGSIAAGAYAGAALAFAGVLLSVELDDPKVDGKYDADDYFGNETHPGILTLMILPVFLPAIGSAIGYRLGRMPQNDSGDGHETGRPGGLPPAVSLPAPRFFRLASGNQPIPGFELSVRF